MDRPQVATGEQLQEVARLIQDAKVRATPRKDRDLVWFRETSREPVEKSQVALRMHDDRTITAEPTTTDLAQYYVSGLSNNHRVDTIHLFLEHTKAAKEGRQVTLAPRSEFETNLQQAQAAQQEVVKQWEVVTEQFEALQHADRTGQALDQSTVARFATLNDEIRELRARQLLREEALLRTAGLVETETPAIRFSQIREADQIGEQARKTMWGVQSALDQQDKTQAGIQLEKSEWDPRSVDGRYQRDGHGVVLERGQDRVRSLHDELYRKVIGWRQEMVAAREEQGGNGRGKDDASRFNITAGITAVQGRIEDAQGADVDASQALAELQKVQVQWGVDARLSAENEVTEADNKYVLQTGFPVEPAKQRELNEETIELFEQEHVFGPTGQTFDISH